MREEIGGLEGLPLKDSESCFFTGVLCYDPLQSSGGGELVIDSLEKSRRS
jgi:hypothetical protein